MRGKIKEEKFFGDWRVMEKKRVKIRVLEDKREQKTWRAHNSSFQHTHTQPLKNEN